ncbi:MAG: hypothetical protein Q9162_002309 [Coniocarpon cinnabarinum]
MVVRLNSLINGQSGVRSVIIDQMLDLLRVNAIPLVPLHGSISASGDLQPLAYIAGAVEGKSTARCWVDAAQGKRKVVTADQVFSRVGRTPRSFSAKEALGLVNGTAMSCAVGCLALYETHGLATLAQVLTTMSVEALKGTEESFEPVFATSRPHPGQVESTNLMRNFLKQSRLKRETGQRPEPGALVQDRYSLRTTPQWVGPVLEDLTLAHQQLIIECNSVTDNPLIDTSKEGQARYLSGGNFQAKAVTSAMEKTRQALQSLGRMSFCQLTEMINPAFNVGLPPNLVVDEPSETYLLKSTDIMAAAYLSELGFLANPVGSHVQTAEMGNQALNSLALISARYTMTAVDVASKLLAAHLLAVCQAIDLRVIELQFFEALIQYNHERIIQHLMDWVRVSGSEHGQESHLWQQTFDQDPQAMAECLMIDIRKAFESTTSMDSSDRFKHIARSLMATLLEHVVSNSSSTPLSFGGLPSNWTDKVAASLLTAFTEARDAYIANGDAMPYLGQASRIMYNYVRKELRVPLLRNDVLRSKDPKIGEVPTIGMFMTRIYGAMRKGEMEVPLAACLKEAGVEVYEGDAKAKL